MRSNTRRTHLGWQKILDIKTSTLIPLRRANAVADASTAQQARRRKPSRHQIDTKLEGSTLTRSGKGSTSRKHGVHTVLEGWLVSPTAPRGLAFVSQHPVMHGCMHACIHSLVGISGAKVPIFKFMLKRCLGSSLRYHFDDHSRVKMVSQTSSGSRRAAFLVQASSHSRAGHRNSRHLAML